MFSYSLTHLFTMFNCSLSYVNGFLVQRTADERTAKAVELEQKVALLEVDNNNLFFDSSDDFVSTLVIKY